MTKYSACLVAVGATFLAASSVSAQSGEASSAPMPPSPDTISQAAAIYGTYHEDVGEIKTKPLSSIGDIDRALLNLGGQNADQLARGWLAYSALVASQSIEFRDAVRDIEGFYGRDRVLLGLRNDIRYAGTLDGADGALSSALAALDADSRRIDTAAAYVKEQAYSLQGAGWAKARLGNSSARASKIGESAKAGRPVRPEIAMAFSSSEGATALRGAGHAGAPSLWEGISVAASSVRFPALGTVASGRPKQVRSGQEIVADRIATLAAYRVLGVEGEEAAQVQTALADKGAKSCLVKAQLNLQQCVAASYKHYEVPFCIGQHALSEVGGCIDDVVQ